MRHVYELSALSPQSPVVIPTVIPFLRATIRSTICYNRVDDRSSKMVSHAGSGVVGKHFIGAADQGIEVRIGRHAEKGASAGTNIVPFDAIKPAILIRATPWRQHDGRRQS